MNENWYKDIMSQNFQYDNYFDPTKLFVALSFVATGALNKQYHIKDVATYVYRYYVANIAIARRNINIVVRNIEKYGVEDIVPFTKSAIAQWIKEQKYGSLALHEDIITLFLDSYDSSVVAMTRTICDTLFQKYYKTKLLNICNYSEFIGISDYDIVALSNSPLKQLIFEDVQYCPLTEITDAESLFVVRISGKDETEDSEELIDKDNLMLFSQEIAEDYASGLFYFDTFGRVINRGSKNVSNRMRMGIKLLTPGRKKYIKRHSEYLIKQ